MMNLDDVRKDGVDPGEVLLQLGAAVHRGPNPISVLLQQGRQERTRITWKAIWKVLTESRL